MSAADVPWLTVEQMREVDRVATEELGLPLERMMENAGGALAALSADLLGGTVRNREVLVLAGPGGDGGGGLVAARHLAAAGAHVTVRVTASADRLSSVTRAQYEIVRRAGIASAVGSHLLPESELTIDALLGYSQAGPPRPEAAELMVATAGRRILALDVPPGLELATGELDEPHVRADATLTLAAPKRSLRSRKAEAAAGDLYLADLSIPPVVYERLGIDYRSPFHAASIVRVM